MKGNPAEAIIAAVEEHLAGWRPASGMDLYEMLLTLPEAFGSLREALQGVLDGISEEQDLPNWFTTTAGELIKAVTTAQEQAASMDAEFQKAYAFFIADRAAKRPGRRRKR